jgi:chemotaxis signal transduction protein
MKTEAFDRQIDVDESNAKPVRLQLLRAGSLLCAIPAAEVSAIIRWQHPTPLPNAPQSVLGVVSVHGCMFTVLDLAELTSENPAVEETARHIISLRGDEQLALAVDEVGGLIELAANESTSELKEGLIAGSLNRNNEEVNILNLKELFSTAIQGRERRRRRF